MFAEKELEPGDDVNAAIGDTEQDEAAAGGGGVSFGNGGGEVFQRLSDDFGGNVGGSRHVGVGLCRAGNGG